MVSGVVHRAPVIRSQDLHSFYHFGVQQPGAYTPFDLLHGKVGGDHQGELVDVPVVQNLEELLLRPAGGVLCAEIIQDQQRGPADRFEPLFKSGYSGFWYANRSEFSRSGTVMKRVGMPRLTLKLAMAAAR